jgi:hypothetical protein
MHKLIECQIDKQIRWFEKHNIIEHADERILRPLKWVKHCIHVINNDTELYEYDFKTHKKTYKGPKVNYRNMKRYVNFAKSRFYNKPTNEFLFKYWKDYPEEYYLLKCKYIMYKTMFYYEEGWWD